MKKPELNDTVYMVTDSVYYNKNRMPETEYRILKGTVIGIIHGGYTVYELKFKNAGQNNLRFPRLMDFGKRFFFDRESAIVAAGNFSDEYDRKWGKITGRVRRTYPYEGEADGRTV